MFPPETIKMDDPHAGDKVTRTKPRPPEPGFWAHVFGSESTTEHVPAGIRIEGRAIHMALATPPWPGAPVVGQGPKAAPSQLCWPYPPKFWYV